MTNPRLFIVGAARSGTTLLQRIVNAHREIAVMGETYWVPRKFGVEAGLTPDGMVTPRLIDLLEADPQFTGIGLNAADVRRILGSDDQIRYSDFVARVFDLFAEHSGKRLAGDKSPGYVRRMHFVHRVCPDAKFVHIIRDGRDLCLSMLSWEEGERVADKGLGTWAASPVVTSALYWRRSITIGQEAGDILGSTLYREVRYESLVLDPFGECRALCEFLEVDFDPAMLRYHEGRTREDPRLSSKDRWLPPTPGLRDWRTQMPESDIELFEASAGSLLADLGYARAYPFPSEQAESQASTIFRTYTDAARRLGHPLPARW